MCLLAVPLNVHLLDALEEKERSLADLSEAVGLPPASTMRSYLRTLSEWGVVERKQETAFPGSVRYELTSAGEELVQAGQILQRWLKTAPKGEIGIGSATAKSAIKALVDGWEAAIIRALAVRPCTLTELARALPKLSYPTLERRLTAMRRVGLVEGRRNGNGRGTPYAATPWLSAAVTPMIAATVWERRHAPTRTAPIGRLDVEAALLLALPMLRLPAETSGSCRLGVELRSGGEIRYAGVTAQVESGRAVAAVARLGGRPDASVTGTAAGWYRWVNGGDDDEVEIGGDSGFAQALGDGLREALVQGRRV